MKLCLVLPKQRVLGESGDQQCSSHLPHTSEQLMNTQIPKKTNSLLEPINFIPTTVSLEHKKYKKSFT